MPALSFKCPLCSCQFYGSVIVQNRDGSPYRSDLLHCLGCSAVFLEPALFTAAPAVAKEFPLLITPMEHEAALRLQGFEWRYWHARLKRKDGGGDLSSDAVVNYKLRMLR